MPIITAEDAPTFETPGATITGLASPSRGATDVAAWRIALEPGHESPKHSLVDREEGGREALEAAGIPVLVLTRASDIMTRVPSASLLE